MPSTSLSDTPGAESVSELEDLESTVARLVRGDVPEAHEVEALIERLQDLVSTAARLYAAAAGALDADPDPLEPGVSTTDSVILATALLKARDLNPFDLALWFARGRVAG